MRSAVTALEMRSSAVGSVAGLALGGERREHFSPEFRSLLATATQELCRHVRGSAGNGSVHCVLCGSLWPCERVCSAALLLEVI
jgi:hypothetical protein